MIHHTYICQQVEKPSHHYYYYTSSFHIGQYPLSRFTIKAMFLKLALLQLTRGASNVTGPFRLIVSAPQLVLMDQSNS